MNAPEKKPVGYEIPATYFCSRCVPDAIADAGDPLMEADDDTSYYPNSCAGCGRELTNTTWKEDNPDDDDEPG